MNDESGFLGKLLEDPTDDTTRLVYADWLTERGDAESATKAEFLRLTVQLRQRGRTDDRHRAELQPLAAQLAPEWLGVVSRIPVDRCGAKLAPAARLRWLRAQFDFVCDREWDEMTPTAELGVRVCEQCKENVHYCDTIVTARAHAERGHCVAVDLGVLRRDGDLAAPIGMVRGKINVERARQLARQRPLDPVSQEREEQKRQQNAPHATSEP